MNYDTRETSSYKLILMKIDKIKVWANSAHKTEKWHTEIESPSLKHLHQNSSKVSGSRNSSFERWRSKRGTTERWNKTVENGQDERVDIEKLADMFTLTGPRVAWTTKRINGGSCASGRNEPFREAPR